MCQTKFGNSLNSCDTCALIPDSNTQHSAPKQKLLKEQKHSKTAEYYMHRKDLKPLNLGDSVTMQPIASGDKIWKPATVTKVLITGHTKYRVKAKRTAETEGYYALHQLSLMLMMKFQRPHQSRQTSPSNVLILL